MRTPLEPRRPPVGLTVAAPAEAAPRDPSRIPYLPWLVAALAWSAAVAALGWAAIGALVSVAWLTAVHLAAADVFAAIGQLWLLVHGAPAVLDGATITLVPTGLTAVAMAGCAVAGHHAAGQHGLEPEAPPARYWRAWASVTGACVLGYLAVGGILALVVGSSGQAGQALGGLVLVPLVGASVGVLLGLPEDALAGAPAWARRLPGAVGVGAAVLAAGALAAALVALIAHRDAVALLHASLEPDAVGSVLLALTQAAYLPSVLAWAGSFVLGAGVTLGSSGLVAPGVATPALLPAVPLFGAIPAVPGVADGAWLAVGPLAGAAAAAWALRGMRTSWPTGLGLGALAGLLPGLAWVAASWFTRGDLGVDHLVGLGPRFPDLLVWGTLPLAAAGAAWGLARALWLSRRTARAEDGSPTG